MSIFDKIFRSKTSEEVKTDTKAIENLGAIFAPIFREIPPNNKAGLFTLEGMRSWAYIAISAIADEVSTNDIELYKKQKEGWVEIEEHQVLNLLQKPNKIQTKEEFLWLITVYLLAEGEAPIMLNSSKNPTEMALLNPSNVKVLYDSSSIVSGYEYRKSNGTSQTIPADQVIFIKLPNYMTPFRGMGIMKYVAQTLDIDNYMEEYLRLFFFNDATPGSVLETDKELSRTVYERIRSQLKLKHQGYKKSHKNLILENGLKWVQIGMKLNELQIKELQDSIRDKVLASFKVPKSVIGITEDVNRANGENSDRVFAKRCIKPKLKIIEGQINQYLIPKFSDGANLWFEFENPVKDDELIQSQVDVAYATAGIWTINEIRERMGMMPIEDVKEIKPENEKQDNENDETGEKIFCKKHKNPSKINKYFIEKNEEKVKSSYEITSTFSEYLKDFLKEKEIKKEFSFEEKCDFHTKKIEMTNTIENNYKFQLKQYFTRLSAKVLGQIKSYKKKEINLNIDKEEESKLMMEISIPFIEEALIKESELAYSLLGLNGNSLSSQDKLVREFIQSRSLKLGKSTSQTTTDDVQKIFKNWSEEKGTIADLRNSIKEYFDSPDRADMIARTEISNAVGFAQETVYAEVGAESKQWLTAEDEKVCEFCAEMDGKTTGVSSNFWDQGESMIGQKGGTFDFGFDDVSSPPLHPLCRCDLIPVFIESKNMEYFKEKQKKEIERIISIQKKEDDINKIEIKLISKEENIAKKELELNKELEKNKEINKSIKKELKEIEKFKDSLNGN